MAGLFDDLIPGAKPGTAGGGMFGDLIPAKPKPAGFLRSVADLGIEAASGVARGVKATADAFGADNVVSRGADTVDKFAREYLSAAAKADDQRVSEIMAAAQDAGVWEQVKAAAEAFTVKPGGMIANALGTSVPTIATALIPGIGQAGAAARLGALGVMGAAQGAGAVKGSIYEAVKAEQIRAGASAAEAEAAAVRAQEYGGENTANIAGGAALGGAASATGVQPVIAKMLQRGAEPVAQAQRGILQRALNPEGLVARTGMGALKEAPLEAAQGGQEQYASNIALQNEGFDTPAFRGVAGSAALEGLASAGPGAAFAALDRPGVRPADEPKPEPKPAGPVLPLAYNPEPMVQFADGSVARRSDAEKYINSLPEDQRPAARAKMMGMAPQKATVSDVLGADSVEDAIDLANKAIGMRRPIPTGEATEYEGFPPFTPVEDITYQPPADKIPAGQATELAPEVINADVALMQFRTPEQIAAEGMPRIPAGEATEVESIPTGDATELEPIPAGEATDYDPDADMVPRRKTDGVPLDLSQSRAVAGYVERMRGINTPAARAFVQDYRAGRITDADVMGLLVPTRRADPTPDERIAAAAAQAPKQEVQPGDILTADGMPYGSKTAANVRAVKEGLTVASVIEIPGAGWVVRPKEVPNAADVARPGGQRADDRGGSNRAAGVPDQRPSDVLASPGATAGQGVAGPGTAGGGSTEPAALIDPKASAPYYVRQPGTGRQIPVPSPEAAAQALGDLAARTGAKPVDGSIDVYDAQTGLPVFNVKPDGTVKKVETREEAEARSRRMIEDEKRTVDAPTFTEGQRVTLNGTPYTVTAANNSAVKLQGEDGATKMVARNSKTFGQIQAEAAPAPAEAPRSMMKPGFDPEAWQKERDERIKASREAGNTHLDQVPAYVETMRGKDVYYVHDPKVRGRILTVDNNGNVYVEWLDKYSQDKEGATPMKMGKRQVMQSSLGPRDLKDYVAGKPTQEPNEAARPQAQAAAGESAAPAAAPAPAAPAVVPGAGGAAVQADGVKARKTLQEARTDAALDKQVRENGEVLTRRQWVERKVAEGLKTKITQEDRIKPMSRMAFFRANNEEQRAHDRKVKEAGKKDVYWIGDYEVTKIEHDYANALSAAPKSGAPVVEPANATSRVAEPAGPNGQPQTAGPALQPTSGEAAPAPAPEAAPQGKSADDYLTELFGTPAEQAAAQERFMAADAQRKQDEAKATEAQRADAKRIRDAIGAEVKRAQAEHDDWSSRTYKANKTQVDLRGDGPSNQASMSIGAINESRRRNALEALTQELKALDKLGKAIATDEGAAEFMARMRQDYRQAENAARDGGWSGMKTADELFQYNLLDDLKFRGTGGKGSVTSNGLSKAVLAAIKPEAATPAATPATLTPKAQAVKEALAATHKDPGEPAEPVTPVVVREAIKTGVQDTGRKPSAMRAELLREIDRAIEEAPDYGDYQALVKSMGQKDGAAVMMESGEKGAPPGYSRPKRTFKVEGDGIFTIQNSVRQLLLFREKVEKSPGFKDRQAPAGLNERATDALDRRSTDAAVANMVDEGDFQAALDYAEAKGVDIANVKLSKVLRDRLEKWQKDQASAKAIADYEAARAEGKPAPGSLAAAFAEKEAEAAPAAEPEADDIPEAGIASQTFDQWVRAEYAGNEYKDKYLEEFGGDERRAILGAAIGTIDNDRKTPDLLKEARAKYHGELLALPRETSISLDVWDALDNMAKVEAQRHFYDLDRRITRRTQDETKARVEAERVKKAPYEAAFAEVDAEIRRLDALPGPETQKQKDLSARRDRLREALYQIGQGKEPDGRLLRKEAAPAEAPKAEQAPAEPNKFAEYDAEARQYGYEVRPDGSIGSDGKFPGVKMVLKGGRLRVESGAGNLLGSYAPTPASLGKFLEGFWYAERKKQPEATEPALDLKGFTRTPRGNGAFDLSDGNMRVSVEPTERGKFQARFGSAKSSPHLQGEQAAVDWAAQYRKDATPAAAPAEQAAAILNAAAEPPKGAERLSVIKDVKAGAITPEEVAAAYPAAEQSAPAVENDRNTFTLQRVDDETRQMGPVTFRRGQRVKVAHSHPMKVGVIDGISHAERKVSVDGLWTDFGYVYPESYDEFKKHRESVAKQLATIAQRLDDNNSIEAENMLRAAKQEADHYKIGAEFADQISRLTQQAAKVQAETAERFKAEREASIQRRSDAPEQAPRPPIKMTMEEWKAVPKDYKGTFDGVRTVMREGGMVAVEIVKAAEPEATGPVAADAALWKKVTAGEATPDEFKAGFEAWVSGKDAILAEFNGKTKADLLKMGGAWFTSRHKGDTKPEIAEALWRQGASAYTLGRSFQYGMGKDSYTNGIRRMVEATDADQLAQYVAEVKAEQEQALARVAKVAEAIKDPKTLSDYQTWMRATMEGGKSFKEARMMLTPEQRAAYDELAADSTRSSRKVRQDTERTSVSAAGQAVSGQVIATKHTRDGHNLWVVQLSAKVPTEDYMKLLASAKRMGGNYSSFRGNGAVPGFQFRSPEAAQAFLKLAGGDTSQATEVAQERRNAFEDDRSQSAAERLTEMADRLEERADESLNRDRKANTDRRARFAASAEAAARADKAMATTMRNIAKSIEQGGAKFLDRVRQKVQVEMLQNVIRTAKDAQTREKYPTYGEQEKHRGEPPDMETADYADFPMFTAYRSDLASLGRKLLEVDGTKKLGERLMKVADDVSDAFNAFVKEPGNLMRLSTFSIRTGDDVKAAIFPTREAAERSITRSELSGKAIVFPEKRGVNRIIMSPSEAMARGIWKGDGDKRITLSDDFGNELVEKIGRAERRGAKVSVPWQFERSYDRRKQLARMGIETPAEFRAALREFIVMREQPAEADKIKAMERAMIGRRNDGLDFFPTPESVADEMVAAADIQPGMRVLEPSAGMGHIAERVRAVDAEPDVVEFSNDRRELLEAKGFNVVGRDFMEVKEGGYDRILMNPPFSDGRDIQHVRHAYDLLKPGGRLVAIMGEGAFFQQNKRATEFREWLESVGGTDEKLPEGTFNDPSLPVNTGANARMVVIEKPATEAPKGSDADSTVFSRPGSPYWFSALSDQVEKASMNAGPASAWQSMLKNWISTGKVKADEVEWSGLGDWLGMQTGKVSKAQVAEFLESKRGAEDDAQFSRANQVPLEASDAVGREFWRKIDNGESFTEQEVLDALATNRTGTVRRPQAVVVPEGQAGVGQSVIRWADEIAGLDGYRTSAAWAGDSFTVYVVPEELAAGADLTDPAQARDKAAVAYAFTPLNGGRYDFSVNDVAPDGEAMALLAERGLLEPAGTPDKPYRRIKIGQTQSRGLMQEAVRRLALNIGQAPAIFYAQRDTGARAGRADSGREYTAEKVSNRFSTMRGGPNRGVPMPDAKAVVARIRAALPTAPPVHLLETLNQAPKALREAIKASGAENLEAAYHAGEIYVFPRNIPSIERMQFVVGHHEVRHHGIRSMLGNGDELGAAMHAMWEGNENLRKLAQAKIDAGLANTRALAVEEALADMGPDEVAQFKGWPRVLAAMRQWLRQVAAKFRAAGLTALADAIEPKTWTDADVARFVLRAEGVSKGQTSVMSAGGTVFAQKAYHGTPHRGIEKFSTDKIGTGEGAQAYGWGLYFASKREVAEHYREMLSARDAKGYVDAHLNARRLVERFKGDPEWAAEVVKEQRDALSPGDENYTRLDQTLKFIESGDYAKPLPDRGQLYEVAVPDDSELLMWDKPMRDQPAAVKEAVLYGMGLEGKWQNGASGERRFIQPPDASMTGGAAYARISRLMGGDQAASKALEAAGVKGIKYLDGDSRTDGDGTHNYVIFSGDDVAITGTVYSRPAPTQVAKAVRSTVADFMGNAGAKVSWWDKTLATQYAKAEKFPAFKRVFDHAQQYLEDVSSLANQAADKAPSILPKLETWKDLKKFGLSEADAKAVAGPIFTGTLTDEKVYSDAELRSQFNLTPAQIDQYREFLATVNESLDQVVAADVLRLLGDKNPALRELAVEDRAALRDGVQDYLESQIAEAQDPDTTADLQQTLKSIQEKYARVDDLKAKGYAPLMRFGQYAVNVEDPATGESLFFGLYESRRAANAAFRDLQQDPKFARATITQGVLSEEQYKLFSAVPMESLEMFAEAIGASDNEVFQAYLKLAKNNRSALKRMIQRKGTAGFSEDVPRVLAAFTTSNARLASNIMNMAAAKEAAMDIRDGDIKDEAIKLVETVSNPGDRAGWIRALMFMQFIGGSVASALVNLTQPVTMTLPYLSQFGGTAKASARLLAAGKTAAGGKPGNTALALALKRAEADGVVSPQEIHQLVSQAAGSWGNHPWLKRAAFVWSAPFSLAEQFNRRVTFIAAWNTAKDQGIEDPFGFASKAVVETQGLYNAGNMPNWARTPLGAAALTFKQFSISYLEWMGRMWKSGPAGKKAVAVALALLILMAGTDGLPFADDMDDLVDTLAQALGYDLNSKKARREFVANTLGFGDEGADVAARGFSALAGFPLDVSLRMSMGNLLPGSGILLRSNTDKSGALLEVAGPAGSLAKQYLEGAAGLLRGEPAEAAKLVVPIAVQNVIKGAEMAATGEARDQLGRKVMDVDAMDAAVKAVGFNPSSIARESQKISMVRRSEQLAKNVEGEIAADWARAIVDKDQDGIADARRKLAEWNEDNPDNPIRITMQQLIQRAKKLRQTREQRFITTVAPERRQAVAEAIR